MTRHLFAYGLIPFLLASLVAQQAPPSSAPASPAPAAPTTAPAQPASGSLLQDGTPMKLRLLNKIDSHTAKEGDEIPFDVINDVVVGGVTVLRRGTSVTGVVTQAVSNKTMGRAGRLSFSINDIKLRNGSKVPVRAFNRTSGENRAGEMVYLMLNMPMVSAPFFLFIKGTNTTFPRGTEINAFVNGDLPLDMASFAAAPPAPAADEIKTALQITSTPDGAQVQIDGAAFGTTPLNVTVTAGKHDIAIKKAGYSDWSKTLDVTRATAQVEATLEAMPQQ
jgi:PEGA domain